MPADYDWSLLPGERSGQHGDQTAGWDAGLLEIMGQLVGLDVHIAEGDGIAFRNELHRVRGAGDLLFEELRDREAEQIQDGGNRLGKVDRDGCI